LSQQWLVLWRGRRADVQGRGKGTHRINEERVQEAIGTGANVVASACPFCNTMLTDGVKSKKRR
jgi:Cysteine-rich domain.